MTSYLLSHLFGRLRQEDQLSPGVGEQSRKYSKTLLQR